jgi:hypothetical protein
MLFLAVNIESPRIDSVPTAWEIKCVPDRWGCRKPFESKPENIAHGKYVPPRVLV